MSVIKNALIIGGGIAGMSLGIELRKRAMAVDLVEIDSQWRVYGARITINGAGLRAFRNFKSLRGRRQQPLLSQDSFYRLFWAQSIRHHGGRPSDRAVAHTVTAR
jgi:2-polyprenyl-6-methoxyphenol hydroxylase-like FAD-dependent oxidoreductase